MIILATVTLIFAILYRADDRSLTAYKKLREEEKQFLNKQL